MYLKKSVGERHQQIGKGSSTCISSDFRPNPSLFYSQIRQIQTKTKSQSYAQNTITTATHFTPNKPEAKTHLTVQIPPTSPNPPNQNHQFQHENPSPAAPSRVLSTRHKRPMMTQSLSLSHSPTLSSLTNSHHHHLYQQKSNNKNLNSDSSSSSSSYLLSFLCSTSCAIPSSTKRLAHKLLRHILRARLLCFHVRFLILLSLPSLYFFVSSPRRFFLLIFLSLLAFLLTILLFLNLALPRLPSIRLFLARSLPLKLSSRPSSAKSRSPPVVWSIGPKPKSEKKLNSGSWVQDYSNGDVYEGEFHRGKCSGSGVYYYNMKGRYEGDWVDGKYDGYGVETWAKGSRYRGQYMQGLRHGIGVYRFYTGDIYAGEWSNGQCHGCGVHTCEDGSRYVGEFKRGVKHGLGNYHFRNGDIYAGEYFADKMNGFGVYRFGNGHRYEGAWHEGRRQGLGMYTFRNGETRSGHWQNGVLDSKSTPDTDHRSPNGVSHSKVLSAVQEAQRAAERAFNLAKVDERVSRAVASANKAANAARVAAVKAVQKRMQHSSIDDVPTPIV